MAKDSKAYPAKGVLIGHVVQLHEVIQVLGQGGMGEVYLARHQTLGALRALKVIHDDIKSQPNMAARFQREAQVLTRLQHPNIVAVIDYGQLDNGWPYLLLEFVRGGDLFGILRQQGPMTLATALVVLTQLARVIEFAHGQGVVHRDLKPGNVLLGHGDPHQVKVIDFGLAKLISAEMLTRLTADRQIMGSPHYMAPEQAEGAPKITGAADVYALAGIAYALLSGQSVFGHRPPLALIYAHACEAPTRLSARVVIPHRLDELLYACLAKDPDARPSAATLASELDVLLAEFGTSAAAQPRLQVTLAVPAPGGTSAIDVTTMDVATMSIPDNDLASLAGSLHGNDLFPHERESDAPKVLLSRSMVRAVDVANAADLIFAPMASADDRRGSAVREALQRQMLAVVGELAEILAVRDPELVSCRHSIGAIEEELAEFEIDVALLDAALGEAREGTLADLAERRAEVAMRTHQLHNRLAAEQRTLAVMVDSKRPAAPPHASSLYTELDQMIVRAQILDGTMHDSR